MQLLGDFSDIEIVAKASNLEETFEICLSTLPDILLVDAKFPDTLSTIRKINKELASIKIVLLSMTANRKQMSAFAGEGVMEFVTCDDSVDDLRQSITAAMANGFWCSSRVAKLLLEPYPSSNEPKESFVDSSLTRQQFNVLQLIEAGLANKDIARKLHIETATVKNHVHHILQRLHVTSRGQAAAAYRRHSYADTHAFVTKIT